VLFQAGANEQIRIVWQKSAWKAMPGVAIGPADLALLPLPAREELCCQDSHDMGMDQYLLIPDEHP
jgi:hypothetical protein